MSRKHTPVYKAINDYLLKGDVLNQSFLIEALFRYATQVLSNPEAVREQLKSINSDAWIKCAKDAIGTLDKHFVKNT